MNEDVIDLAMRVLVYSALGSPQEVRNDTSKEVFLKLQYIFPKEVLDEAVKRLAEVAGGHNRL